MRVQTCKAYLEPPKSIEKVLLKMVSVSKGRFYNTSTRNLGQYGADNEQNESIHEKSVP